MLEKNVEYFAERVEDYKNFYFRDDEEFIIDNYFKPKGKILVLGCGAGRTLIPLHNRGLDVTGIDIMPEMINAAQSKISDLPIKLEMMDATNLTFADSTFDFVFFPFHGIDCVYPEISLSVREAARVLKPGGIFIFNSHNRWFLKKINLAFSGKYVNYSGAIIGRSTPLEYCKLKEYFKSIRIKYRISMQKSESCNWKDRLYKLFPFLSNSIYFICKDPKK